MYKPPSVLRLLALPRKSPAKIEKRFFSDEERSERFCETGSSFWPQAPGRFLGGAREVAALVLVVPAHQPLLDGHLSLPRRAAAARGAKRESARTRSLTDPCPCSHIPHQMRLASPREARRHRTSARLSVGCDRCRWRWHPHVSTSEQSVHVEARRKGEKERVEFVHCSCRGERRKQTSVIG